MPLLKAQSVLLALTMIVGLMLPATQSRADTAVLAGGCFWCVESDFEQIKGVSEVVSGFTGGKTKNPTYKQVSAGGTGHYEAVEITYDPATVSYAQLLHLFLRSIDPTDPGGQFCDRGDSYRTAIFVSNNAEKAIAEKAIADAQGELGRKVVTKILPTSKFTKADAYHQNYYKQTGIVITRRGPKSKKEAYKFYRQACGRDAKVRSLWGSDAPFVGH